MGIKPKYIASPVNCLLNHFLGYKSNTKTNTHSIPSMLVKSLVLRTKEAQKSSQHRLWSNNASNDYEFQLQGQWVPGAYKIFRYHCNETH